MNKVIIHWFRQDLRLTDNPSLYEAAENAELLPVYILDDQNASDFRMGEASRVWLHHSLNSLDKSLKDNLLLAIGDPLKILLGLADKYGCQTVHWNRCYEPWRVYRDTEIKKQLLKNGIEVKSFNGSLLWEPWEVLKQDGSPYRVFTPFYRKGCLNALAPRSPLPKPRKMKFAGNIDRSTTIEDLKLRPDIPWDEQLASSWKIGEAGAKKTLKKFLDIGIDGYKEGRNFPAEDKTSRLSPHLHFGELSPNQVWHAIKTIGENNDIDNFCSELGWREFSYNLLYHNPKLPEKNIQTKFDKFPWKTSRHHLIAWQKGKTGYPIIDAGMRELWNTGYMHNRVRMIVGSFLVKNLMIHWREGFSWFWDCLVDADLANNAASWQWIAGCGVDAAPYFRIFNPVTQSQKFDKKGNYIKKWVPELNNLPEKYLHAPYDAPENILKEADINLGENYPAPIVELKQSREQALSAFKSLSA